MKHGRTLGRGGLNDTRRRGQRTKTCRDLRKQWRETRVGYAGREGVSVGERKRSEESARRGGKGAKTREGDIFLFLRR